MLINSVFPSIDKQDQLRKCFLEKKYLFLKNFINQLTIHQWKNQINSLPSRRVICGDKNIHWEEREINNSHNLFKAIIHSEITQFSLEISGYNVNLLKNIQMWINIYNVGEYINLHTDRSGDIQLALCLQDIHPSNGGVLHLQQNGENIPIFMSEGDGLLFDATHIPHYTTPLISTEVCSTPQRIVLVIRYYLTKSV